jgi:hypothetical protein
MVIGVAGTTARVVNLLFWALMALYVGFLAWWAFALVTEGPASAPSSRSAFWAQNFTLPLGAWSHRPDVSIGGVPTNLRNPAVYASYIDGLDEAQQALEHLQPDRSQSVYALDFPSFAFSVASGYRVPRGARAWLLYGHEITLDSFPSAQGLLQDVDVLMVAKCSLVGRNRYYLERIYRLDIQSNWTLRQETRCWNIYFRK